MEQGRVAENTTRMSSHKRIELSEHAQSDFENILRYTLYAWGEPQMHRYEALLTEALEAICQYPESGAARSGLSRKHRVKAAGRHVIVYAVQERAVYVSRILHARMDATHSDMPEEG